MSDLEFKTRLMGAQGSFLMGRTMAAVSFSTIEDFGEREREEKNDNEGLGVRGGGLRSKRCPLKGVTSCNQI